MVTAERFAASNGSYWVTVLPRLEHFVRVSNAGPRRFKPTILWDTEPKRHALVSETAFYTWAEFQSTGHSNMRRALDRARNRLSQLSAQVNTAQGLSVQETRMALELARRLDHYATLLKMDDISIEPSLAGCGWLSGGLPDIISTVTIPGRDPISLIAEVKTVNRSFRSVDLRQIVTYIVLCFSQYRRIPQMMALINPLLGTALEVGVEDFFADVVGLPASEVVNHLLIEWSTAGVSP